MTIDLRSDTVTLPTDIMIAAMVDATVGDDGRIGRDGRTEDPTVRRLEDRAAELTGKPSALFVPSGTFGNMLGVLALSNGSLPIWVNEQAHVLAVERALFDGDLFAREHSKYTRLGEVPKRSREGEHKRLLLVEDTVSSDAGRPLCPSELHRIDDLHYAGWAIHMDGARLFNAVVATEMTAAQITQSCDTVTFCLSKGLGAPSGSMLCGEESTISRARILRKRLGGAMRQSGYSAAAGLIALDESNVELLRDDHRRAAIITEAIGVIDGGIEHSGTNIVAIRLSKPIAELATDLLFHQGYLVKHISDTEIRIVTHRGITDEHAQLAGEAIADCIDAAANQIKEN